MADEESPLLKALPPASDYLTYLTIVEYNLTQENLPTFHQILQDETLTTNIGWDLVHLLVPLLPESASCLEDIARLGNPREVILKVTESLRLIEYDVDPVNEVEDQSSSNTEDVLVPAAAKSTSFPRKTQPGEQSKAGAGSTQMAETAPDIPLPVSQFTALLSMLAILHPRIKTKFPTRFLSTSLQAILASFSQASAHREEMLTAIVQFIKTIVGVKRPMLPSRKSTGSVAVRSAESPRTAGDPEAVSDTTSEPEEAAIQSKLFQSFLTHIAEEYLLNLEDGGDVPGMAWCSRLMEKLQPERIIDGEDTFMRRFSEVDKYRRRVDDLGQLIALAQDLKLTSEALFAATKLVETLPLLGHDEDEPPTSAKDIPLSRIGALFLYTAIQVSRILYDRPSPNQHLAIFHDHRELLRNCLASPENGSGFLGQEPEALVDAVLVLGLICLEENEIGQPESNEQFNEYLQVTALLSSNCPSPNLRGHAHYLTSTVLRSQPDDEVRFGFIHDTMEHCPFENLKVSAVGWIKGETIEANGPTLMPGHNHDHDETDGGESSIFATPKALERLGPYLFPSLHVDLVTAPVPEAWMTFRTNVSFYLASLNFIYLLLHARQLHQKLEIQDLWTNADIAGSFLQPLRDARARFSQELGSNGELAGESGEEVRAELNLLEQTIERVTQAVAHLHHAPRGGT
nr:hypothetical protein CFP56_02657 [Quercus suber]